MEATESQPQSKDVISVRRLPIIPECELLYENGQGSSALCSGCKKNPGHPTFIPVKQFNLEHLPSEHRTEKFLEFIRHRCEAVVKIVVKYTSPNRPDVYPNSDQPYPYSVIKGSDRVARTGTGMICTLVTVEDCPCEECVELGEGKRRRYKMPHVVTASHVIFDELEAVNAVFECFYDSEDKSSVKCLHGVKNDFFSSLAHGGHDVCMVKCFTHDEELLRKLNELHKRKVYMNETTIPESPWAYMISHPHGMPKKITVGNILHFNVIRNNSDTDTHCNVNDVKLRLPKNSKSTSNEYFVPGMNSDKFVTMTPGVEYSIQGGVKIILIPDAAFYFRYQNFDDTWISFPKGTKIYTAACGREIMFPPETEFCRIGMSCFPKDSFYTMYVTYSIDTCPGSSGATVVEHSIGHTLPWIIHSGALEDGVNTSGHGQPAA